MTVAHAIMAADRLYPNTFTEEEKIGWLKKMDEKIISSLFSLYTDSEKQTLPDYTETSVSLLIESPYDLLYLYELECRMAYWSRDTETYNHAAVLYRNLYETYEREYHRTHRPKGAPRFVF
ncbi:MAG: hypothetical protein IJA86_03595 [Clostridia bacterium]|nr:hypothetical protein [Clostridia bacterium]